MRYRWFFKVVFLINLLVARQVCAEAPSFDCKKASTAVEEAVCSDSDLSALDAVLATVFSAKKRNLVASANQQLISDQRQWLDQRRKRCPLSMPLNKYLPPDRQAAIECLRDEYRIRIAHLQGREADQDLVPDTSFHPDFWGMDLIKKYPELHDKLDSLHPGPLVSEAYEDEAGNIIVRILAGGDKRPGWAKIRVFDIYLFTGQISEVHTVDVGGVKKYSDPGPGWTMVYGYGHWNDEPVLENGAKILREVANHNICNDPVTDGIALVEPQKYPGLFVHLIQKVYVAGGFEYGGGCDPDTTSHRTTTIAQAEGIGMVALKDGTYLVWPVGWASDLVRLDRHLQSRYRSPQVIVISNWQTRSLPRERGTVAVQKFLLSLF